MSQTGEIRFFSVEEPDDPRETLERVFRWGGVEKVLTVSRYETQEFSWDDWQELLAAQASESWKQEPSEPSAWIEVVEDDYEAQLYQCSIAEALECYEPGKLLHVSVVYSPQGMRLFAAIDNGIPASLRHDFSPGDLSIYVGPHDLFDTEESPEGTLFGRAQFSVGFFGYGSPIDRKGTRRAILALPEVQAIRRELEAIIGPLEVCVVWNT